MRTFLTTTFLTIGLFTLSIAQALDSLKISQTIERYIAQNGFSGTILVAEQGQVIYHQSFGQTNRSTSASLQNDCHYSIASITKLFTAIRILQLAEAGTIDLDRPVVDYLPAYEKQLLKAVTIHHLLLHISGLPNEQDKIYHQRYQPRAFLEQVFKKGKMNSFEKFNYNNVDYVLLGLLIEKLTNNTWADEIRKYILTPLAMAETGFLEYGNYPKNFAYSSTFDNKGRKKKPDALFYIENFYAAGNLYSTTLDLLKLDQALYTNNLLNEKSKALLLQSYPEYNYVGYGVWNYQYPFVRKQPKVMERRGGILGANVVLVRLLNENYSIVILSNDNRFNPDSFGDPDNLREMLIQALY